MCLTDFGLCSLSDDVYARCELEASAWNSYLCLQDLVHLQWFYLVFYDRMCSSDGWFCYVEDWSGGQFYLGISFLFCILKKYAFDDARVNDIRIRPNFLFLIISIFFWNFYACFMQSACNNCIIKLFIISVLFFCVLVLFILLSCSLSLTFLLWQWLQRLRAFYDIVVFGYSGRRGWWEFVSLPLSYPDSDCTIEPVRALLCYVTALSINKYLITISVLWPCKHGRKFSKEQLFCNNNKKYSIVLVLMCHWHRPAL